LFLAALRSPFVSDVNAATGFFPFPCLFSGDRDPGSRRPTLSPGLLSSLPSPPVRVRDRGPNSPSLARFAVASRPEASPCSFLSVNLLSFSPPKKLIVAPSPWAVNLQRSCRWSGVSPISPLPPPRKSVLPLLLPGFRFWVQLFFGFSVWVLLSVVPLKGDLPSLLASRTSLVCSVKRHFVLLTPPFPRLPFRWAKVRLILQIASLSFPLWLFESDFPLNKVCSTPPSDCSFGQSPTPGAPGGLHSP